MQQAFDQQKAKTNGSITPNKGVDPEYDAAIADMKTTKKELDDYLEEQRELLKCRVSENNQGLRGLRSF